MEYLRKSGFMMSIIVCFCAFAVVLGGCGQKKNEMTMATGTTVEKQGQAAVKSAVTEAAPVPSAAPITEERTYYDFEVEDLNGWEIPQWALGKESYVAKNAEFSQEVASSGKGSMKVDVDFPGGLWTAGLVEIQQYLDMSNYRVVCADIYLPADAPIGLKAKLILTVGDNWKFVEMSRSVPLLPGEWSTITANIEPGSYDWKRIVPDEEFAQDVRKIAIRIESNRKPKYAGTIFIDNVRVGK